MCYQFKVDKFDEFGILYKDPREKKDGWLWGVFFYAQGFTFTIICNIMYWFNYRQMYFWGYQEQPFAPTNLRQDMLNYLRIFNDKALDYDLGIDSNDWVNAN